MKKSYTSEDLEKLVLQDMNELTLPEECLPSEANWIVTENKPYYPKVLFFREENDAMLWCAFFARDAAKHNNPENVYAVTVAEIRHNQVFNDFTG